MRIGGDPVNLSNGLLNLTNWLGNVIMPTMAGSGGAAPSPGCDSEVDHRISQVKSEPISELA